MQPLRFYLAADEKQMLFKWSQKIRWLRYLEKFYESNQRASAARRQLNRMWLCRIFSGTCQKKFSGSSKSIFYFPEAKALAEKQMNEMKAQIEGKCSVQ